MAKVTHLDTILSPTLTELFSFYTKIILHFLEYYNSHSDFPKSKFAPLNFL